MNGGSQGFFAGMRRRDAVVATPELVNTEESWITVFHHANGILIARDNRDLVSLNW